MTLLIISYVLRMLIYASIIALKYIIFHRREVSGLICSYIVCIYA